MAIPLPLDRAVAMVLDQFTEEKVTTREADEFISELRLAGYEIVPRQKHVPNPPKAGEAKNP